MTSHDSSHGRPPRAGRSRFSPSSLQLHAIFVLVFAIAPISVVVISTGVEMRKATRAEAADYVTRIAEFAAVNESHLISAARQLLVSLSRLPDVRRADAAACATLFADLLREHSRYANIGLVSLDGNVIASGLPARNGIDLSDRSYFRLTVETNDFSIGEYQVGRITDRPGINFGYPVHDEYGRTTAVIFLAMRLDWLNRYERAVVESLPPGSTLTKIDRQSIVLVHIPDTSIVGRQYPPGRLVGRALAENKGFMDAPGPDGVERFYSFIRVNSAIRNGDIVIFVGIPREAIRAKFDRLLNRIAAMCAIAAALMAAAVMALGYQLYRRPLNDLLGAARRLASGDLGARARAMSEVSELGKLAASFNDMADSIQRAEIERVRSAEETERLQRRLAEAQKMEALGALTGAIAHDFSNMLVAIKGNAELALARPGLGNAARDDLAEINAAAERAARLTHQLLVFSRRQELHLKPVDLDRKIGDMANMLDELAGKSVTLSIELASGLLPVRADESNLEQVVLNLVVNAKDAMPDGGSIVVRTNAMEINLDYCRTHPEARPGWHVRLSVTDTGVGMDRETQRKIFEPFFSTKKADRSTGWGLTIVYAIVKQHGGWIDVSSAPNAGTTFMIFLPVSTEGVEEPRDEPPPLRDVMGSGERILVVEDDEAVRDFIIRALDANGYAVRRAAAVDDAAAIIRSEGGVLDLVIADVVLPDGDGLQLVERVEEEHPGLPVLLCSGFVGEEARWETIRARRIPFLQKPFSIMALLKAVRSALDARNANRFRRAP